MDELRAWLRMHGDYRLTIEPWGLYGLWTFKLTGPGIDGALYSWGATLEKRLEDALGWFRRIDAGELPGGNGPRVGDVILLTVTAQVAAVDEHGQPTRAHFLTGTVVHWEPFGGGR